MKAENAENETALSEFSSLIRRYLRLSQHIFLEFSKNNESFPMNRIINLHFIGFALMQQQRPLNEMPSNIPNKFSKMPLFAALY